MCVNVRSEMDIIRGWLAHCFQPHIPKPKLQDATFDQDKISIVLRSTMYLTLARRSLEPLSQSIKREPHLKKKPSGKTKTEILGIIQN